VSSVLAEQASPEGRNVDSFLQGKREGVPNYLQALGGHPQLLQAQVNMFTHAIFEERALPRDLGNKFRWSSVASISPAIA